MERKTAGSATNRRNLLKGIGVGGAALTITSAPAKAVSIKQAGSSIPAVPDASLEIEPIQSLAPQQTTTASVGSSPSDRPRYGSDYMVDALKALDILTVAEIPGSTFAGLQESIINRGMLGDPPMDMLTVTHEEISVSFAHGYAKVAGKPAAAMVHSTVGLQHAAMAIYNAWCDRAPVMVLAGSLTAPEARESWVDWLHAVSDGPALTRDFTKFDETPRTLSHFADSLMRGYQMAMTRPHGPVVLALDLDLQEHEIPADAKLPEVRKPRIVQPQGDMAAVKEAAAILAKAENPVLAVDHTAHSEAGLALIVELAELLSAAVIDDSGRMNFPFRHPLNQSIRKGAALRAADVVLALEVQDMERSTGQAVNAKRISISSYDYYLKSNYQAFEAMPAVDLAIAGDPVTTLPSLIEAVRAALPRGSRSAIEARGKALAKAHADTLAASRQAAAVGWDARPISTARAWAEVYDQVKDKDWALVGGCHFEGLWPQQLWDAKHHYQFIGDSGGYGLGYLPGAAVGAAYAHREHGRLPIVFGGDGDFMMAPGAIWTAGQHNIPLLYLVHNNGGYHQEVMKVQHQANARNRGIRRAGIGNLLPDIDYSQIARGMGVAAERVTDPGDLRGAISRALDVISRGEPALIDVVSQGR